MDALNPYALKPELTPHPRTRTMMVPLSQAVKLCLEASDEGRLYPKDAYDSVFFHASDRDMLPEDLIAIARDQLATE